MPDEWDKPHLPLTMSILYLNSALDSGEYDDISTEEVLRHIDNGSILEFLRERVPPAAGMVGQFDEKSGLREWYVGHLQSLYDAYGGGESKWGVRNKGLALLLAWTNEILQQGNHWRRNEDYSRR